MKLIEIKVVLLVAWKWVMHMYVSSVFCYLIKVSMSLVQIKVLYQCPCCSDNYLAHVFEVKDIVGDLEQVRCSVQ